MVARSCRSGWARSFCWRVAGALALALAARLRYLRHVKHKRKHWLRHGCTLGLACFGGALGASSRLAHAHVSVSEENNNRYVKLTPYADRVRLAYTVQYGNKPGRAMRANMDRNRDGTIADEEGRALTTALAEELRSALRIEIDAHVTPVHWQTVALGLGEPRTDGGAFAVDFIGWLCLGSPNGEHVLTIRDELRLPMPGETEVRIEDNLGISIVAAQIGELRNSAHEFKLLGEPAALVNPGLTLRFAADEQAVIPDGQCTALRARRQPGRPRTWLWGLLGLGLLGTGGMVWRTRRRQHQS